MTYIYPAPERVRDFFTSIPESCLIGMTKRMQIAEVVTMNQSTSLYQDMAKRTGGSIYIGVVGPVRTGKSTFIKRFMESQVLPNMSDDYRRERAKDELPQSGSGRTIMTAEPKFVPEEAVQISAGEGSDFSVRLVDCVGYMVPGAMGQMEDELPRMVMTPWSEQEMPMTEAAEIGTQKVINEHSTVGIVVTTDGTITDIPRQDYVEAEERVIRELQSIGKPFVVLLNSTDPDSEGVKALAAQLENRYQVQCIPVNCLYLTDSQITGILQDLLFEFPLQEMDFYLPAWIDALPSEHPLRTALYQAISQETGDLAHIRDIRRCLQGLRSREEVDDASIRSINLGTGVAEAEVEMPREMFYDTVSQRSGLTVHDDGDIMELLTDLGGVKVEYEKISRALDDAKQTGYGIVMPSVEELNLEDPEIIKQGGRYSVRMKASAPSIHMIRADVETTVSPIVGNEKQSEDMVNYLLQEFEGDTSKIWQSNIFGRSFNEIVSDDLQAKLKRMPDDARGKLQQTLERIINEGGGGLICIIL